MNNQKNIALAMMNFESGKKHFPGYLNPLALGYGTPTVSGGEVTTAVYNAPVSWVVALLPYLDRRDVSDQYQGFLAAATVSGITEFSELSLGILLCPSDPAEGPRPQSGVRRQPRNQWL